MKKVTRIFCAILCIAVIFSIFAISAYADRGKLWAKSGSEGYLKISHVAIITCSDGSTISYPFPKYSPFRLQSDLYVNDETAFGILTDFNTGKSITHLNVPVYKLYMATATDSLPPDIS